MSKYPSIKDDKFYEKTNKKFKEFKIKKSNKTYDQWCYPKKFTLQLPQRFLVQFYKSKYPVYGFINLSSNW